MNAVPVGTNFAEAASRPLPPDFALVLSNRKWQFTLLISTRCCLRAIRSHAPRTVMQVTEPCRAM